MNCELCNKPLGWSPDPSKSAAANAASAPMPRICVKNWCLHGDESGYHYFCSTECANKYRFTFVSAMADKLRAALRQVSKDMHERSSRPCPTCRDVTAALGEPFGCEVR